MFECPVTASARTHLYAIIKTSINGESKLQQCLSLSCGKTVVAKFVSCEFWNDKRAIVHNAIAMFLQKAAWHNIICNAFTCVYMRKCYAKLSAKTNLRMTAVMSS
jgi:hypothetical protein